MFLRFKRLGLFSTSPNLKHSQKPIHTHKNYSFYVMQPQHTAEVLPLVTNVFAQNNPFFRSILLLHPEKASIYEESIRKFWTVGLS